MSKKLNNYYYDIRVDLKNYPAAWCYIVVGGRNTGKTYSTLKMCYEDNKKFVFVKRTNEDVKLICAGSGKLGSKMASYGVDLSPFKSLNRDININVKAFLIFDGLGGFWKCDDENNPVGDPIGYIISLNSVTKVKGFDLSECDYLIFDEFIPQPWERVSRKEGEMVLDLYKTISRAREHLDREALKLICLANATSVSNPITNILEVTDLLVEMDIIYADVRYLEDRAILIHKIIDSPEFYEKEKNSPIYKAMAGTQWADMALENKFAYNDTSNVSRLNLKQFQCLCKIRYKKHDYYVYFKEGQYYMTEKRSNHYSFEYDLNKENDQKRFWLENGIDLRCECINGNMLFDTYTMYDIIVNYKKFFII